MNPEVNYKPPSSLYMKIRNEAPVITAGENYGRSGGYYGDDDIETRGYKAVLVYIQKGLVDYYELFLNVARVILNVQKGSCIKYPLVPFCFGDSDKLTHEGKYFDFGYTSDFSNVQKIADTLARISGNESGTIPSIIYELYPKVGIKALYGGKTNVDYNDLLVIIGNKGEVAFSPELVQKITSRIKRHILFVEIDKGIIHWYFHLKIFDNLKI